MSGGKAGGGKGIEGRGPGRFIMAEVSRPIREESLDVAGNY